jgi:predicted component of type VI protein secretion system
MNWNAQRQRRALTAEVYRLKDARQKLLTKLSELATSPGEALRERRVHRTNFKAN